MLATMVIIAILFGTKLFGHWMLWSLVPGVIIDVVLLKKWVSRAYRINNKVLAPIYLFYSVVADEVGWGVGDETVHIDSL